MPFLYDDHATASWSLSFDKRMTAAEIDTIYQVLQGSGWVLLGSTGFVFYRVLLVRSRYRDAQAKLAASSVLPDPLYFATSGYWQRGRVRSTVPEVRCDATICAGAFPVRTHSSIAATLSNESVPGPP